MRVAHLTTVDLSLRYLVMPQLEAVIGEGGEAIGISASGPFVPELERAGIRHVPLPGSTRGMSLRSDVRAALSLWRILRSERVDILHTHNPKPGVYGRIIGRLAGVGCVVNTVHGLFATEEDSRAKRWIVYCLEILAARCSDAELIQNPEDVEVLRRLPLYPGHLLRYLGNGVDLVRFDPNRFSERKRADMRAALGIGDGQVAVGAIGRLVAEKGYLELFEATKNLGPDVVVLAIGPDDPDKADALPESAMEAARQNGVRFLGMRRDVDQIYAALDIFVLPSHREGYPRVAMEAAAMGLPVIASNIRGCRQVVDHGVTGLLIPVRDSQALAGAIRLLRDDPQLRAKMAVAARARAKELFDERRVVETVMDTYRSLLAGQDPKRSARATASNAAMKQP